MLNVCLLIDGLEPGGTETSTVALARELAKLDVRPVVVIVRRPEGYLFDDLLNAGVEVRHLAARTTWGRINELRRFARLQYFDIVHTALPKSDIIGRLAMVATGIPVISSFVNTPYDKMRIRHSDIPHWKYRAHQTVDAVTSHLFVNHFHAVSEGVKDSNQRALHLKPSKITVVHRGRAVENLSQINENERQNLLESLSLGPTTRLILNVGRLDHQKAQVDFVCAAEILSGQLNDLAFAIAGKDGNASAAVHDAVTRARESGVNIQTLGHRLDVAGLISAADVLVISSLYEGTSGVAIEAMALGTPIVATNIEGLNGILRHGENALLAEISQPTSIAERIEEILNDPHLANDLLIQGRQDFDLNFDIRIAASRMATLYGDIVSRRAKRKGKTSP